MPIYKTVRTRTFDVIIEATDENEAMRLAEHFVVDRDGSLSHHREEFKFEIKHIEMTENESLEAELIEKDDDEYSEFLD